MKKALAQKIFIVLILPSLMACVSKKPQIIIDPASVADAEQLPIDTNECISIAKTYDLSGEVASKGAAGAAIGATAVAGVATAVAGAVFLPAVPWIIAGGLAGGGIWGSSASKAESRAREKILEGCMIDRGYRVYSSS